MRWWQAELGADRPLVDIAPADISECRSRLARKEPSGGPTSPGTQNRYLTVLKHVFAKARREWQWVTDNPVVQVEARKEPRGRDRYLSTEERARLLTACRASSNPRLYSIVVVALGTGARRGELLALSWSDVDFQARRAGSCSGPALSTVAGCSHPYSATPAAGWLGQLRRLRPPKPSWVRVRPDLRQSRSLFRPVLCRRLHLPGGELRLSGLLSSRTPRARSPPCGRPGLRARDFRGMLDPRVALSLVPARL